MSKINCHPALIVLLAVITTYSNASKNKKELVPEKVCRVPKDFKDTLFTRTEKISYQYPSAGVNVSIDTSYYQYYGGMIDVRRSTFDRKHILLCLAAPKLSVKIHLIRDSATDLTEMDPAYPNPFEIKGEPAPEGSYLRRDEGWFGNFYITCEECYKGLPSKRYRGLLNDYLFDKNDQCYLRFEGGFYNLSLD